MVSLVPTQLRRLRRAGLESAPGLRAMLLGGGPVPPDLLEWAAEQGLPARCTYGMTETASQVVVTEVGETAGRAAARRPDRDGARRRDPGGREMVAPGAMAADGLLHTGDLGRFDRDGRLHVEGRIKELIVTGGEKVAPAVVEARSGSPGGGGRRAWRGARTRSGARP